jgi:hypothetical protein
MRLNVIFVIFKSLFFHVINRIYMYISLLSLLFYIVLSMFTNYFLNDFMFFYLPTQFLEKFSLVKMYDVDAFVKFNQAYFGIKYGGWFYPPHYVLFTYVFGLLPYAIAKFLFIASSVVLFVFAVYVWCQKIPRTCNILFYVCATPLMYYVIIIGQNSLYTASFLLLGLHFLDKKPIISGLCLGLLTCKPQFVIIIPFALLLTRHYKVVYYLSMCFAIQAITSIVIFGLQPWIAFLKTADVVFRLLATDILHVSLMISSFSTFIALGIPLPLAKSLSWIWFISVSGIGLYIWYIRKGDQLAKAILVSAIYLATPYMFHYDFFICIIAILFYIQYQEFKMSTIEKNMYIFFNITYFALTVSGNACFLMIYKILIFSYLMSWHYRHNLRCIA